MRLTPELLPDLDPVDQKIVAALAENGRLSVPALATAVGVSRATAYTRFDRLVTSGVIRRFGIEVDHAQVGLDVSAVVLVNVRQQRWGDLRRQLLELTGVAWLGLAAGPFDFILHVRATDLAHLRDVILVDIQSLEGVRSAQTVVLLDEQSALDGDPVN